MTISVRKLLLGLLLLGLLALAGWTIWQAPRAAAPVSGTPGAGTTSAGIRVTFADQSMQWNWQPDACAGPLATFVTAPLAVQVVLTDNTADQHLIVAYPDPGRPETAQAAAQCRHTVNAALECQVGVRAGSGVNLDVATAAAVAYALQESVRPKTKAAYDARPAWAWANFQPALVKEGSQWHACLQLSAVK